MTAVNALAIGDTQDVTFNYAVTDNDGAVSSVASITITVNGLSATALPDPIRVEAESYVNYYDTTPGNESGGCPPHAGSVCSG